MRLSRFYNIRQVNLLKLLIFVYFIYLIFSRFFYLHADFPKDDINSAYWSCNIEEKASAYNARNKVLFGDWDSGGINYQPMVHMPLSNLISLLSFSLFGVSLSSLRAPYALCSILAFFIFYLILKKEFGRLFALYGTILFSSIHLITCLNRSGTAENIFILLMVTAMFFYQKFLRTKQDDYLFLFGLFSALNLSVKLSGIYFIIIAFVSILTMLSQKEITFSRKKNILTKFLFGVLAGIVIYILLFLIFYMPGSLKTMRIMISANTRFGINSIFYRLKNGILYFFLSYAPIITFLILIGFLFLILSFKNTLSKLDLFNIIWLILGALIILPAFVYYKRTIFLFSPICYLITKTFYIFWQRCKDKYGKAVTKAQFIYNIIICIIFLKLMLPFLDYIQGYFTSVYNNYNVQGNLIRGLILLGIIFLVIIISLSFFIFQKKFPEYRYAFMVFAIMITFSIVLNEFLNFRIIYFPKNGLSFESYNNSKDLGELLKPTTILGPEIAFRMLGFENRHKFIFRHDGTNLDNSYVGPVSYEKDLQRQIKDITANNQIRYFCLFYYVDKIREYIDGVEKIKRFYADTKLLRRYKFGPLYIELYDKYPNVRAIQS